MLSGFFTVQTGFRWGKQCWQISGIKYGPGDSVVFFCAKSESLLACSDIYDLILKITLKLQT